MARYCFYCGSELAQGKRCQCQQSQSFRKSEERQSEPASSATETSSEAPPTKNKSRKTAKKKKNKRKFSTLSDQLWTLSPLLGQSILSTALYFSRPSTKIRQEAVRPKRTTTYCSIFAFAVTTGLVSMVLLTSSSNILYKMLTALINLDAYVLTRNKFATFVFFFFAAIFYILILAASFRISCAFARKKIKYRRILDLLAISLIYVVFIEGLLLIFSLFGSAGTISLMAAAACMMVLANYLSLRNALGLSEDATLLITAFSYCLGTTVIRLVFPSATHFFVGLL